MTELPTDQCAHCLGHRDHSAPDLHPKTTSPSGGYWIVSRFPGRCTGCGERYDAGTQIIRDGDGWLAECCADTD